jgi:hypothetical protein
MNTVLPAALPLSAPLGVDRRIPVVTGGEVAELVLDRHVFLLTVRYFTGG